MANGTAFLGNLTNLTAELGLTALGKQSPASVTITGGTLDGVTIGATTKAAGAFTNLSATGMLSVGGSSAFNGTATFNSINGNGAFSIFNSTGLSTSASSSFNVASIGTNTGNADTIRLDYNRFATNPNTGWGTAYARIYRNVDATAMGFIQFGSAFTNGLQTVELGIGASSAVVVTTASISITPPTSIAGLLSLSPNSSGTAGAINKIALFSSTYGLGISNGSLDYISGGAHNFYVSGLSGAALTILNSGTITAIGQLISSGTGAALVANDRNVAGDMGQIYRANGTTRLYDSTSGTGTDIITYSASAIALNKATTITGTVNISGLLTVVSGIFTNNRTTTNDIYVQSTATNTNGQGAYLQWNRSAGTGATYLVNQKGGGTGGIYLGESDTSNNFAQAAMFSPTASSILGTLFVGGNTQIGNNARLDCSNGVTFYDSAARSYLSGITSEVGSQLIDFGINYSQLGTITSSVQGGCIRVDTRSGSPLFQFLGNRGGGSVATMDNGGNLAINGSLNASGVTAPSAAKAWVVFTNTGSITASYNVSSVAVSNTDYYTITFPSGVFADVNYGYACSMQTDSNSAIESLVRSAGSTKSTTSVQFEAVAGASGGGYNSAVSGTSEYCVWFYHT